jgi:hypothetical protein
LHTLFSTARAVGAAVLPSGVASFLSPAFQNVPPTFCRLVGASVWAIILCNKKYDVRPLQAKVFRPSREMLKRLLKNNIEIEHRGRVRHPVVKLVIPSLFHDTEKQFGILKAIIDELERGGPPTSRDQTRAALEEAKQVMKDHIWVEQSIMEALRVVIDAPDGAVIKMLLNQMM